MVRFCMSAINGGFLCFDNLLLCADVMRVEFLSAIKAWLSDDSLFNHILANLQ
jgi:hypothetical protein